MYALAAAKSTTGTRDTSVSKYAAQKGVSPVVFTLKQSSYLERVLFILLHILQ